MAVLAAAALLDELMGRNRNIGPNEKIKINWEDPEYCKFYMVKFCPHDLFVNTRADLGACVKVHDDEAKKLFEQAKSRRKIAYQEEFIRFCTSMLNDVERKIIKGKQRLALSGQKESSSLNMNQTQRNQEQIDLLNERINGLVEEAEQAGIDGNVEHAQGLMKLCDQLKEERDALVKQSNGGHMSTTAEIAASQEKQMEVCEVCGAFLIVGDAQQRIDDHLMGKQHVGYSKLKQAIDEISTAVQAAKEERQTVKSGTVHDRKDRERDREREREREREKDRERDRERRKHREREFEREKERDLKYERERSEIKERSGRDSEKLERRERKERGGDKRERESRREKEKERDRYHHRESGRESKSSRHGHRH